MHPCEVHNPRELVFARGSVPSYSSERRNALKLRGAWLGERAGRVKLNGRLMSKSPLSPIIEAEGLLASVGAFAVLWREMAILRDPQIGDRRLRRARALEDALGESEEIEVLDWGLTKDSEPHELVERSSVRSARLCSSMPSCLG